MERLATVVFALALLVGVGCPARQEKPQDKPAVPAAGAQEGTSAKSAAPSESADKAPAGESATAPEVKQEPVPKTGAEDSTAAQAYWPRFHGPRGDNLSDDRGLLTEWPSDGPPLAWKVEGIGQGYAGVTIADGRIFTAGNIGDNCVITALDLNGKILWQKPNGPAWTKSYPGARGTPTIDGDRVYHLGAAGDLACYRVTDGQELWRINILEKFEAPVPEWGLAESVLIRGPHLYCTPGGPKTCVVALDKMTGQIVWQSESANGDGTSYASLQFGEFEGIPILFTMTAKAIVGVRADTGRLLFRYPHETAYDVNACQPIYHEGHVFVSTGYGSGSVQLRLIREGDTVRVEEAWVNKELDNHHGGVILLNGFLYGSSHNGRWMCLDWKTGETKYADKGVGKGSLTYADGMLYTYSERRMVGLVKATPDKHELISQFRLPSEERAESWAHPVVCGGRLYLRHGNLLVAFDLKKTTS